MPVRSKRTKPRRCACTDAGACSAVLHVLPRTARRVVAQGRTPEGRARQSDASSWGPAQLVPAVTELIVAELLYLQYKDRNKPMFLYINSTGTTRADGETVRT